MSDALSSEEVGVESSRDIQVDELNTLQRIISELKPLQQDVQKRIIETVITFLGFNLYERDSGAGTKERIVGVGHGKPIGLYKFSEDRIMPPKEFLLEKQPESDVERVACLAYYLTHYRDTPYFKTIDISKLNTEAAQRKFSNAAYAVENAAKCGYLASATKGRKQLSASGEVFVQALPDRSATKVIMKKSRPRRKSKDTKSNRPPKK
jgi:hypothetical protein